MSDCLIHNNNNNNNGNDELTMRKNCLQSN